MNQLKVTLVRSATHRIPKHRKIVEALGLKKINSSNVIPDSESTRGALFLVAHLIKVEEV